MAKPRSSLRRRKPLYFRPWLDGSDYDRLTRKGIMHVDLYAYQELFWPVFHIVFSWSGRDVVASDWFTVRDNELVRAAPMQEPVKISWTRDSNRYFRRVHGALLRYARGAAADWKPDNVSLHCHYVPCMDLPPFPRTWVNHYNPQRAKRGKPPAAPATALPDLL